MKRGRNMVIKIDEYSDVPIYMQIRNQIVMGISSGELKAGEQLPTVRALALEIGINTMTAYNFMDFEHGHTAMEDQHIAISTRFLEKYL